MDRSDLTFRQYVSLQKEILLYSEIHTDCIFMGNFLKGVVMSAPLNIRKATAVDIPFLSRIGFPGITQSGLRLSDEVSRN